MISSKETNLKPNQNPVENDQTPQAKWPQIQPKSTPSKSTKASPKISNKNPDPPATPAHSTPPSSPPTSRRNSVTSVEPNAPTSTATSNPSKTNSGTKPSSRNPQRWTKQSSARHLEPALSPQAEARNQVRRNPLTKRGWINPWSLPIASCTANEACSAAERSWWLGISAWYRWNSGRSWARRRNRRRLAQDETRYMIIWRWKHRWMSSRGRNLWLIRPSCTRIMEICITWGTWTISSRVWRRRVCWTTRHCLLRRIRIWFRIDPCWSMSRKSWWIRRVRIV